MVTRTLDHNKITAISDALVLTITFIRKLRAQAEDESVDNSFPLENQNDKNNSLYDFSLYDFSLCVPVGFSNLPTINDDNLTLWLDNVYLPALDDLLFNPNLQIALKDGSKIIIRTGAGIDLLLEELGKTPHYKDKNSDYLANAIFEFYSINVFRGKISFKQIRIAQLKIKLHLQKRWNEKNLFLEKAKRQSSLKPKLDEKIQSLANLFLHSNEPSAQNFFNNITDKNTNLSPEIISDFLELIYTKFYEVDIQSGKYFIQIIADLRYGNEKETDYHFYSQNEGSIRRSLALEVLRAVFKLARPNDTKLESPKKPFPRLFLEDAIQKKDRVIREMRAELAATEKIELMHRLDNFAKRGGLEVTPDKHGKYKIEKKWLHFQNAKTALINKATPELKARIEIAFKIGPPSPAVLKKLELDSEKIINKNSAELNRHRHNFIPDWIRVHVIKNVKNLFKDLRSSLSSSSNKRPPIPEKEKITENGLETDTGSVRALKLFGWQLRDLANRRCPEYEFSPEPGPNQKVPSIN